MYEGEGGQRRIGLALEGLDLLGWAEVSSQCVKEVGSGEWGWGAGWRQVGLRYLRGLNVFFPCHVFFERERVVIGLQQCSRAHCTEVAVCVTM